MAEGNVTLLGDGKCIEGSYHNIKVIGSGELEGKIICDKLTSAGSVEGSGSICFKTMKIAGSLEMNGDLEGDYLKIAGSGGVTGKIKAETCKVYGSLSLGESLDAETFILKGGLEGAKVINSEQLTIQVLGHCEVEEIGGGKIRIGKEVTVSEEGWKKWASKHLTINISDRESKLVANIIEGDDIYIDTAQVGVIRGTCIEIGPNTRVDRAEYTQSIKVHERAKVGEIIQMTSKGNE